MTSGEIIGYVVVPLAIFLFGAIGTGIVLIIKFAVWLTKSREAQEGTAKSTEKIADQLVQFIGSTNFRLNEHGERISVLEDRAGIRHL